MKAKKLNLLFFLCAAQIFYAGTVSQTLVSTIEQKVMGHVFKHVISSSNAQKDEYFIDGRTVVQEKYQQDLEMMQKQERDKEYEQQIIARRARIQFTEMMQVEIAAKLLKGLVLQILQLIERVQNPALEKFCVFTHTTIGSEEQLMQLKNYTLQLESVIDDKIANYDFQGLHALCAKLEPWPPRLEKFFQDTIQNAIKKSDDTMMLKELLKLVGETSAIY